MRAEKNYLNKLTFNGNAKYVSKHANNTNKAVIK